MNRYLRLFWRMLTARFHGRVPLLGPCRTRFRVWPTDLDVLRHVNNGTYLSIMDLGRVDLMLRSGMWTILRARGWYPVVAAETIQFRRSLGLFEAFAIDTRVLGWDERAFLLEQRFVRRGADGEDTVALAIVRAQFLARSGGGVGVEELLAAGGVTHPSPELPAWVARWNEDQLALKEELKSGATVRG